LSSLFPRPRRVVAAALLAALAAGAADQSARAEPQGWPLRPITVLVGASPGRPLDVAARTLLPHVERQLRKARFVIVNQAGNGGEKAAADLAAAEPDGYTLGFIGTPALLTPLIERRPAYTIESFTYVARLTADPVVLVVAAASPMRSLRDFLGRARRDPGALSGATPGNASATHLALLQFEQLAGIQLEHVPFAGPAQARGAVLNGPAAFATLPLSDAATPLRDGKLRALGLAAPRRSSLLPDAPTFREQGIELEAAATRGLVAPRGLDPGIAARLADAVRRAIADEAYRAQPEIQIATTAFLDGAAYAEFVRAEYARIGRLWAEQPWTPRRTATEPGR